MKNFFLHPTVKKICYIVGLLTIVGWLLGLVGKGIYHTAYNNGLIPEEHTYREWHERHGRHEDRPEKYYRRLANMCHQFFEEVTKEQESTTKEEVTE